MYTSISTNISTHKLSNSHTNLSPRRPKKLSMPLYSINCLRAREEHIRVCFMTVCLVAGVVTINGVKTRLLMASKCVYTFNKEIQQ